MPGPNKIILIDDSYTTNFLNQLVIEKSKFDIPVQAFEKPAVAIDEFSEKLDISDHLIFVDINMPDMDGWDVVRELEKQNLHANNIIVMLTSSIDPRDEQRASEDPAIHGFMTKPLTFEMLDQIINGHFLAESSSL